MAHPARQLESTLERYRSVIAYRDDRLFTHFLPIGYEKMTLSTVPRPYRAMLNACKVHLGMFITLLDDFADNPIHFNPRLLETLHAVPFHFDPTDDREVVKLAKFLIDGALEPLVSLPNYEVLWPVLRFDLEQFLNANHYSSLITRMPSLANAWESASYGPHNMGMIAVGTMDLMASPSFPTEELGRAREILAMGQRIGRICNVLVTIGRETAEGDVTNEALIRRSRSELEWERDDLLSALGRYRLNSFSVPRYRQSLIALKDLHESMEGII